MRRFRSGLIGLLVLCGILFYMEGLFRSRLLPVIVLAAVLMGSLLIPFSNKLPLLIQRSLTFLPLDLDKEAEISAKASTEWRLEIWSNVLPLVPRYLILGKGLGIDQRDMQMLQGGLNRGAEGGYGAALAGDYHSGPLSLIVPFGIPGVIGFVWFLCASALKCCTRNYKFWRTRIMRRINRFLFASFISKVIMFIVIFGSFYSDLIYFVGPIGLSIALNGGVQSPAVEPVVRPVMNRFKLASAAR